MSAVAWDTVRAQVDRVATAKPHRKRLAAFRDITAGDTEDLFQDVAVALLSMTAATRQYTKGLRRRVNLLAYRCLRLTYLRAMTIRRRRTEIELHLIRTVDTDEVDRGDALMAATSIIKNAMQHLGARSRTVLLARYANNATLSECGVLIGVSKERARQIERISLYKLKRGPHWRELKQLQAVLN